MRFWRRSVYGGVIEVQSFSTVAKVAYNLRGNETILLNRGSIDGYVQESKDVHNIYHLKFTRAASSTVGSRFLSISVLQCFFIGL